MATPNELLQVALSREEEGARDSAERLYRKVIEQHPTSDAAERAKKLLERAQRGNLVRIDGTPTVEVDQPLHVKIVDLDVGFVSLAWFFAKVAIAIIPGALIAIMLWHIAGLLLSGGFREILPSITSLPDP